MRKRTMVVIIRSLAHILQLLLPLIQARWEVTIGFTLVSNLFISPSILVLVDFVRVSSFIYPLFAQSRVWELMIPSFHLGSAVGGLHEHTDINRWQGHTERQGVLEAAQKFGVILSIAPFDQDCVLEIEMSDQPAEILWCDVGCCHVWIRLLYEWKRFLPI